MWPGEGQRRGCEERGPGTHRARSPAPSSLSRTGRFRSRVSQRERIQGSLIHFHNQTGGGWERGKRGQDARRSAC